MSSTHAALLERRGRDMAEYPTIVIACHVRDGRDWVEMNQPKRVVVVTPRSLHGARGIVGDSVAWTRGALCLPREVRDRLWDVVAPCFAT